MDIATIVGHLAFGLIAFSYLVKDIMYLRILSIVASLFGMFFNYTVPAEPLWLPIGWNAIFVMVNIYHISVLLYEKRPVQMDDNCLLYTSPSPRDLLKSRMPSSA